MKDYEFEPEYEHLKKENPPPTSGPMIGSGSGQAEADAYNLKRHMERIREEQNLPLAIVGGVGGALIGALLWAFLAYNSEYQLGLITIVVFSLIAIVVGFIVGFGVRRLGKGVDQIFGVIGASFAVLGIVAGNMLAILLLIPKYQPVTFFDVLLNLLFSPRLVIDIMVETFDLIRILFYGLAIYQGYKLSFRRITQEEIDRAMGTGQPVSF